MYIGIHNHTEDSNFRLRDSINKIPDLINYCHELGHAGVCITDHETISNAIQVEKYMDKVRDLPDWKDFKVGLGNEIYLCPEETCAENKDNPQYMIFPHFILVAVDAVGHKQIRELSTRAWSRAFMYRGIMRVPTHVSDLVEVIGGNKGHIIASTACIGGSIPQLILRGEKSKCTAWIDAMLDIFGEGYFFLELQPSWNIEQRTVNRALIKLSRLTNVPFIITTDAHYLKKEDANIHSIFLKSQDGDREVDEFYASTYVMSETEIHEYLDSNIGPENVQEGLDNTMLIYDKLQSYSLKKPLHIPYAPLNNSEPSKELFEKYVNVIPLLDDFYRSKESCDRHLVRAITEALEEDETFRTPEMYEHIGVCLDTIIKSSDKMNVRWSAYLLQIADYVKVAWTKGNSLVGVARGSGCGFGLLNILGITQVNPLNEVTKTYPWRFLNPERASVLDIDIDIEANKRDSVVSALKETYGEDRISKVLTYSTEGSRSAIITTARGLGIDNDIASYIASLVVADRGMTRSLHTMYYGDDDNKPVGEFVNMMNQYPELWEGAQKIEGLVNGMGSHAGGIIFVDEPFTETTALMKTNSGDTITAFDLHECEETSLIKVDLLSIEALDKIRAELDLLLKDGLIEWQGDLKSTYDKYIGVKTLERNDPEMWRLLWEHKVLSLFQMEKDSGVQAISLVKPNSVDQLATLNSVIRLMAQDKNAESPLQKFARFRYDINEWYKEMDAAGLTEEEKDILKDILGVSFGICEAQEFLVLLVMHPKIGGFSLSWGDRLRKSVAKKNPKDFAQLEIEFFENAKAKQLSKNLTHYVWYTLIYTQRGYGFNKSHTLAYSLIALQELNLCHKYPIVYWNCANLCVDSGSLEGTDKTTNYGKMATAIARMKANDITVELPLIESAERGFVPDVTNNQILFSLKAINGVGDDDVAAIIQNRPYHSFEDFCKRMVGGETRLITTSTMVALIKAGAFTKLDNPDRKSTMDKYLRTYVFSPNTQLTMANIRKIMNMNILPDTLQLQMRFYNFKAYILDEKRCVKLVVEEGKKVPKCGYHDRWFKVDSLAMPFYIEHFSEDSVVDVDESGYFISEKRFIKECDRMMAELKEWLKSEESLIAFNKAAYQEVWDKYAHGSIPSWDMAALSFYYTSHELDGIDLSDYGVVDFNKLPEQPVIYDTYKRRINGEDIYIPKFEIVRLAGTVLNADNNHHMVALLTTTGVVNVKFSKGQYAFYNKQISAQLEEGSKKTVLEKSWFKRGTLLMVCGYRQDDSFRAYRYKDTVYLHTVYKIDQIADNGEMKILSERAEV